MGAMEVRTAIDIIQNLYGKAPHYVNKKQRKVERGEVHKTVWEGGFLGLADRGKIC